MTVSVGERRSLVDVACHYERPLPMRSPNEHSLYSDQRSTRPNPGVSTPKTETERAPILESHHPIASPLAFQNRL
jgi:hypothetical protein